MTHHEEMIERAAQAQREIGRALHAAADPAWLRLDLTMGQLKALILLSDPAALTVGGLADQLGIGKPAASLLVDRLVQLQLVTRTEDAQDRRRTLLALTPEGGALVVQLREGGVNRLRTLMGRLDDDDLAALVRGLQALARVAAVDLEPAHA
jgi:DNA-binding MarR family transcriptional regulator